MYLGAKLLILLNTMIALRYLMRSVRGIHFSFENISLLGYIVSLISKMIRAALFWDRSKLWTWVELPQLIEQ